MMNKRKKRFYQYSALGSVVAVALALTGCSADTGGGDGPGDEAVEVLLFAGPYATVAQQMLPEFEKESGIKVDLTVLGGEVINQKTSTELLGGGTSFDVMSIRGDSMPFYGSSSVLADLSDFLEDSELTPPEYELSDITPMVMNYYNWKGAQVGMPWIADAYITYYRTDLVEQAGLSGPPTSAEEYAEYAKKLTNAPEVYGTGLTMQRSHNLSSEYYQWLSIFGGAVVDGDGNSVVDSPEARESLKHYVALKDSAPPDVTNWAFERLTTGLSQGEVAMALQWASVASVMEDESQSKVAGKMGYAPTPSSPNAASVVGGWGLSIPAASKNQENAFKFIAWMTGPEMTREIAVLGGGPARMSLLNDKEMNEQFPWFKAQGQSLENAVARPRTPGWPEIDDFMSTELSQVVTGSLAQEEAIARIAEKVEEIVTRK
ncbi:sugar ABC transporter substrate-binding protein [Leifsonia bigeumensis]|uniref:Sugar ABC transporter substrate-binding protein n=1 Tax=Leifsonella bigeumensis TaxID=433643 RepID=A0ABP7FFK7_9MICO